MPLEYSKIESTLKENPKRWLVTGGAGFIGSNIVERLLELSQEVVVLDNLSTGSFKNLETFSLKIKFFEGDVSNIETCLEVTNDVDYVLHQAALGSVPRSIKSPLNSHQANVNGHLNMLHACVENNVKNFVFASSSSVYGDNNDLPKIEDKVGNVLSPYAATKKINEIYADVFNRTYGLNSVGLRYFNVFGKNQSPDGPYAAVIPLWIKGMISNEDVFIFGDGTTSRDFCFIENVIQANIVAAVNQVQGAQVVNISFGGNTTLRELFTIIRDALKEKCNIEYTKEPVFKDFRAGDIKHSQALTQKAAEVIGYKPLVDIKEGIKKTINWYVENYS